MQLSILQKVLKIKKQSVTKSFLSICILILIYNLYYLFSMDLKVTTTVFFINIVLFFNLQASFKQNSVYEKYLSSYFRSIFIVLY